jgi:hypothetical protein
MWISELLAIKKMFPGYSDFYRELDAHTWHFCSQSSLFAKRKTGIIPEEMIPVSRKQLGYGK